MTVSKNQARRSFEHHLDLLRRRAKKENLNFSVLMYINMPSEDKHIRLADALSKPEDREAQIIERYRPYYYEWLINEIIWENLEAHHKILVGRKRGGLIRGEQQKQESSIRQAKILKKQDELIDSGIEKPSNKLIAKELDEDPAYVRKFRAKWKRKIKAADN